MTKEKPNDKNMHSGHRMRVINSYSQIDLDVLSPHQVLEFILFYVFTRGDVNPLAHRLLDKYGTVQNVLDANPIELQKIYGINERSAQMLTGFTKIFTYYTGSKLSKKFKFKEVSDIYDFCEDLLRFYNQEILYGIALDASFHVTAKRILGKGVANMVALDPHEVIDFINETKAANIILAHNHPGGFCTPTENDLLGTNIVKKIIEYMRCQFIDHIIIGSDGIFSIAQNLKVRTFSNTEDIKEVVQNLKEE